MTFFIGRVLPMLSALFLLFPAEARKIYVYLGAPRDGYGDMSPNLWAAERIKQRYPNDDVSIVYEKVNLRQLSGLEALVGGEIEDSRKLLAAKGISLIEVESQGAFSQLPQADIGIFLSAPPLSEGHPFNSAAKDVYVVREPIVRLAGPKSVDGAEVPERKLFLSIPGERSTVHEAAAGVGNSGLYLDNEETLNPLSRDELLNLAQEKSTIDLDAMKLKNPAQSDIAVSYTFNTELQERYVAGLVRYAKETGKKVYLFSNHPKLQHLADKNLVEVINLRNTNLEISRRLIATSTPIPPLVTGDSSMAAAIQAEIPFFYEDRPHKRRHLLELVNSGLPVLTGPYSESPQSIPSPDDFVDYVQNEENRRKFATVSKRLKQESSLIAEISKQLGPATSAGVPVGAGGSCKDRLLVLPTQTF